jgi:hypothetical protein
MWPESNYERLGVRKGGQFFNPGYKILVSPENSIKNSDRDSGSDQMQFTGVGMDLHAGEISAKVKIFNTFGR